MTNQKVEYTSIDIDAMKYDVFPLEENNQKISFDWILIPEFTKTLSDYLPLIKRLNECHHRVFVLHLPNFNPASVVDVNYLNVFSLSNLIANFISKTKLYDVVLMGSGIVCELLVYVNHMIPNKVKSLVLINEIDKTIYKREDKGILKVLDLATVDQAKKMFKEQKSYLDAIVEKADLQFIVRSACDWNNLVELDRIYRNIHQRTLFVWGAKNNLTSSQHSHDYLFKINHHFRFLTIENSGHYPELDNEDEFFAGLEDFIKNIKN